MFAQKSPIIVSQTVINTVLGYVGLFFITRFLSPDIFGFLAFVIGFGGIFSFIADMGFSSAHQKHIAEGLDIAECNGTYLFVKVVLGFLYVAVVLGALVVWTYVLHHGFENPIEFWMIIAITPYYFFQSMLNFPKAYFTAKLSPARMAVPSIIEAVIRNSIFIGLGMLFFLKLPIRYEVPAAMILAVTYGVSYSMYFFSGFLLGRPWKIGRPTRRMFALYASIAIPLAVSGSLGTINGNIDKVIIQYYWHAVATGAFFLDQRIVQSINALTAAVTVFFLPMLSKISKAEDPEEFGNSITGFERMTSLFTLPFVVMFIMLNFYIVNLFSGAYSHYSTVLAILAVTVYFNVTLNPYISALTARGRTKIIPIVSGFTVGLNIALNFILVPASIFGITFLSLGVRGAAVSSLMAALLSNLMFRFIVYRREGVKPNVYLLKHLIPVGVQMLSIYVMLMYISPYAAYVLVIVGAVSLLVYLGVAILSREISFNQVLTFALSLNPFGILRNLKNER